MTEIYIDDDKEVLIVGKPNFEYEVVHTEYFPERDMKKIWVKKKLDKVTEELLDKYCGKKFFNLLAEDD